MVVHHYGQQPFAVWAIDPHWDTSILSRYLVIAHLWYYRNVTLRLRVMASKVQVGTNEALYAELVDDMLDH